MKVTYTETATSQLEIFKNEQAKKLEKLIVKDRHYPGIESIEISGSDIQKYAKDLDFYKKNTRPQLFRSLILVTYLFLGLTCTLFGIFYDELKYQIEHQPVGGILIITGIFLTIFSVIALIFIKYKDNVTYIKSKPSSQEQVHEIIKIQDQEKARIDQIYQKLMELEKQAKDFHPDDVQVQINQYHT